MVKGGCNLRFWLGSVRFSEDLDLDVIVTAKETLKRKVDRLLAEPLPTLLRTSGLRIASFSAPKQTDTTPRWKVMLEQSGIATPFHTKIEFSRRPSLGEHSYEAVSSALTSRYRMGPTIAAHYSSRAAIAQKIAALAHRTETQARDVFDLAHLLATTGPLVSLEPSTKRDLAAATDRALSVSYDDFSGQVTAFLEPEHRELYASRDAWDSLQSSVLDALEGARS